TRVLFDGIPGPMVFASATQVNAIVPYEIGGRLNVSVQVEFQGVRSPAIVLRVADTAPGIFTLSASCTGGGNGAGQGAILNQNFSINCATNPAAKGSVVQIFGTGEGDTNPRGATGFIIPASGTDLRLPRQLATLAVTIGGQPAEVLYAGSAPGLVS